MKCCNNKKAIDNLYKNIAVKDRLRESEDSREIEKKIALSLGYTLEDLDNEANLGLGCGNPIENALSLGYTLEDLENGANLGLGCGNPIENANLKAGETVLDLGCGKGMDVFKACKIVGKEGLVIGVDRLSEMVERANYIRGKKGFLNTDFRVSDIDDLKVDNDTVDCVISNCVINLCEDKEKVYSEIFRVLKPGGRISISDIVQFNELPTWVKDEPIFHATWVAGSITSVKLKNILKKVGFELYTIIEEELTDEYLAKWGHKLNLRDYIRRGKILAFKPK